MEFVKYSCLRYKMRIFYCVFSKKKWKPIKDSRIKKTVYQHPNVHYRDCKPSVNTLMKTAIFPSYHKFSTGKSCPIFSTNAVFFQAKKMGFGIGWVFLRIYHKCCYDLNKIIFFSKMSVSTIWLFLTFIYMSSCQWKPKVLHKVMLTIQKVGCTKPIPHMIIRGILLPDCHVSDHV